MSVVARQIRSRSEWLSWRLNDVTASDIGGLAGVDAYRTPLKIWAEKTQLVSGPEETNLMRRGRWLEPSIAKALSEERPGWLLTAPGIYLSDLELRLGGTPDYFASRLDRSGQGNVQCKVIAKPTFEREWKDGPPIKYQLQSLTEAMLADCTWNAVVALVLDTYSADLHIFDVPRHPAAEARIIELVADFWAMIAAGQQPAPNYKADAALIKALHPRGGEHPAIDLSQHNRIGFLAEEHLEWQRRKRNAEGALEEVDAEITHILGDHDAAEHPDYKITWKLQQRKEVIIPATEYRVLRVTRRKEDA